MVDGLTGLTVTVFEAVGRALVGDSVKVDLVRMAADAPMSGTVRWDQGAGCWCVLAADACKGRRLLWLLMHELGHVVNGDVDKEHGWLTLDLDRAIMEGTASGAVAAFRRGVLVGAGSEKYADRERKADAFAERLTDQVWPIVEGEYSQVVSELQRGY